MAKNLEGICCKSYTLRGINGGEITISETPDRRSIKITALGTNCIAATLHITAEQFTALCGFDSSYDGLQVKPPLPPEEGVVIITPAPAHHPEAEPVDAI